MRVTWKQKQKHAMIQIQMQQAKDGAHSDVDHHATLAPVVVLADHLDRAVHDEVDPPTLARGLGCTTSQRDGTR